MQKKTRILLVRTLGYFWTIRLMFRRAIFQRVPEWCCQSPPPPGSAFHTNTQQLISPAKPRTVSEVNPARPYRCPHSREPDPRCPVHLPRTIRHRRHTRLGGEQRHQRRGQLGAEGVHLVLLGAVLARPGFVDQVGDHPTRHCTRPRNVGSTGLVRKIRFADWWIGAQAPGSGR